MNMHSVYEYAVYSYVHEGVRPVYASRPYVYVVYVCITGMYSCVLQVLS